MSTRSKTSTSNSGNLALILPVCLTVIVAAAYYIYTAIQNYMADVDSYADHDVMVHFQSNIGMAVIAATLSGLIIMTLTTGSTKHVD